MHPSRGRCLPIACLEHSCAAGYKCGSRRQTRFRRRIPESILIGGLMNQPSDEATDDLEIAGEHEQSPEDVAALARQQELEAHMRRGANWFFWIAGLSVVNAVISLAEGNRHFVVGLGITEIINGVAV